MYQKYFIGSTIGIFLGICFAYSINFSTQVFVVSFVICVMNFLVYKFSKKSFGVYKSETSIFLCLLFLFISIGIILGQYSIAKGISQKNDFKEFISHNEKLSGEIVEVHKSSKSLQLIISSDETEDLNNKKFKIKVTTSLFPEYKVGQRVVLKGKVFEENIILPKVDNQVNDSFDISSYDSLRDIDGQMSFPKIELLDDKLKNKNVFYKSISNLRESRNGFVNKLDELSVRKVSSLASGVLLGDSSLFSKDEVEQFRIAGLSHIIVLSGFNITILIFFFSFIFLNFNIRLRYRILLTLISIIIFIVFVGSGASIVRAGIMGGVLLIANIFGRQYVARQALFLSAFIMIILNPKIVTLDVSFHLSFLATCGILYLVPILDRIKFFNKYEHVKLENKSLSIKDKIIKNVLEIFKVTLAVQIMVLPYIMFTFGQVSLFGILANILVLPLVPIIMILGFFILSFSFLFLPVAKLIASISIPFCKYIFGVASLVGEIPFSNIEHHISILVMVIFYASILFLIFFEDKRIKIKEYLDKDL